MAVFMSMRLRRFLDVLAGLRDKLLHPPGKDRQRMVPGDEALARALVQVGEVGGDLAEHGVQRGFNVPGCGFGEGHGEDLEGLAEHDELGLGDDELLSGRRLHAVYLAWIERQHQNPPPPLAQVPAGGADPLGDFLRSLGVEIA